MTYDGTPKQPGTHEHDHGLTGDNPHFSLAGLREMVVVGRHFTDDANNRSRAFVEYEVRDLYSGEIYTNVRRLQIMGGMVDGDDDVLHPATMPRSGSTDTKVTRFTRANDTDGDRVLVAFVEGSKQRPVIIGVLTHTYAGYGATTTDGERRFTTHKGTTIEIKSNGEYIITHKTGTSFHFTDDGECVITHKSGTTLHFMDNGDVVLDPGTAQIRLGSDAAFEKSVLGTTYRAAEDIMLLAIEALATALAVSAPPMGSAPQQSTTAAAATAAATAIGVFQAAAASYLSVKVDLQ